uniref:Uncharacterized protein n=1 Tax=Candidatus Kentrum sp. FM TaxID=2126340 RepID=A0A450WZQ1_9GAMM|nr:MAG: hypothetical protein BECKFM1743B_GA0114221_108643 [Candidatus Kentron sp. FM]
MILLARLHLRPLMHDPALVKHRENLTHLQSRAENKQTSGPFHLNFDVNGDNKCSNARRACAVIVNYFKHVQRGRRALSILQLTLKFKWNGPLGVCRT